MLQAGIISILAISLISPALFAGPTGSLEAESPYFRVSFEPRSLGISFLAVDSLGQGKLGANALLRGAGDPSLEARRNGDRIEYRPDGAQEDSPATWAFHNSARRLIFETASGENSPAPPLVLDFDLRICHATLLGLMNDDGSVRLPALLHLPDYGTFRITSNAPRPLSLGYEVVPYPPPRQKEKFVRVTFRGATGAMPQIDYTLEAVAIYPEAPGIAQDTRFDGFRRNFLNIFQQSPRFRSLANNAASDTCAVSLWMYAEVAVKAPPLAPGLTTMDLLRQTLDRYFNGMKGCGMKGYNQGTPDETGFDFLDADPSLVIAASDFVLGSNDLAWLRANYPALRGWAEKMLSFDADGDGLIEYAQTKRSGPWPWNHPPNWWDAIWFTNKDAYSNALAYHACLNMALVARRAGIPEDEKYFASRAEKMRAVYATTFFNPATGVLAGWKDAGGDFHDYYFTFVNGMAITYGLVPREQANRIMDHLLAKMHDVGFNRFDLGLPGNLIPIRKADYNDVGIEWGGPQKEDGADAFQNYENGGATACFVYFTIEALYSLGRWEEGDAILFPILHSFKDGFFQSRGAGGRSHDWNRWDGTPKGYEGLLADGYMTLLAVLTRQTKGVARAPSTIGP